MNPSQIDALSEEFQSTFTEFPDRTLGNMCHDNEVEHVKELIKKHLGWPIVNAYKHPQFVGDPYALYLFRKD